VARLIVCSLQDVPSVNMRDSLFEMRQWKEMGEDGKNTFHECDGAIMMTIPEMHIYAESIDKEAERFGISFDDVIFMSRHKAASAIPTLTVHPIGNYSNAEFGGREKTLAKASPALMTDALRRLAKKDTGVYNVSFEVTHHGPYVEKPAFFMEIGSDESAWNDKYAAKILAEAICEMDTNDLPNAVGIGGGHYAPRFSEVARGYKINFGHMIPSYALKDPDDAGIARMIRSACDSTGTKLVYIHKNSMKKADAVYLDDVISSHGFETISSKDLEPAVSGM